MFSIMKICSKTFRHANTFSLLRRSGTKSCFSEDSKEFISVFPEIVNVLTVEKKFHDVPEMSEWLSKVLYYNVPGGKNNRALTLIQSYKLLEDPKNLSRENIKLANIMGWCIEMFQAFLLMFDDQIDGSSTRRGNPCWYKVENVGLYAINDACMLQGSMYYILEKYFRTKPYYKDVHDLFNELLFKTSIGQCVELQSTKGKKQDLETFTMDLYNKIVKYKTAYYTIHMPVTLAMLMSGVKDPKLYEEAETILLQIGEFFQIQDDYLDCYGDAAVTGKIGSDIEMGKCSWPAVVAFQKANPEQKKIMETHYGSSKTEDVKIIKDLYDELKILEAYQTYEETSYNIIKNRIENVSNGLPHSLFFNILDKLYKRKR